MKGNRYLLLLFLVVLCGDAFAQPYKPWWQWAITDSNVTSAYSQTEHVMAARNNRVFWARLRNNKRMSGTLIQGDYSLGEYDTSGKLLNSANITGKLRLLDAQADPAGNWYILGQYYDTLRFGILSPFTRTTGGGGSNDPDYFIARLERGNMSVGWIRFLGHTVGPKAQAFTIANNQLYLAVDSADFTVVWRMNLINGTNNTILRQEGESISSSIQVDRNENIYLAGSCGYNGIRFDNVFQPTVPGNLRPAYIVRYRPGGVRHWHYWMYGTNCVNRKLTLAHDNMVYYTGDLQDSMRIGTKVLNRPASIRDFVAARLDSNGSVAWARQMDGGAGEVTFGHGYHAVVTPDSALVLFAQTHQYINWSNSVGTDAFNTYAATVVSIGPDSNARWGKVAIGQNIGNQHIATDGQDIWITGNGYTNTNFFLFDTMRLYVRPQTYVPYLAKLRLTPRPLGISGTDRLPVIVAPNPAQTQLLVAGLQVLKAPAQIRLTDLTGKVLLRRETTPGAASVTLDVAAFPRGLFFLEIRSGADRRVEKVILQ